MNSSHTVICQHQFQHWFHLFVASNIHRNASQVTPQKWNGDLTISGFVLKLLLHDMVKILSCIDQYGWITINLVFHRIVK